MCRPLLVLTFLLALSLSRVLFAQEISETEAAAYERVSGFRGLDSRAGLSREFEAYLVSYDAFLRVLINGTPLSFDAFEARSGEAMKIIPDNGDERNLFLRAEIDLHRAFVKLKDGAEISAVWIMRQVYRDVAKHIERYPDNMNFKRTWGLLQILVGAIPDNYQWVPKLLGIKGSVENGRNLLLSISADHWLYTESRAFVSLTDSYLLEQSHRAVKSFREIIARERNNKIFNYLYMTLLLRDHRAEEAILFFNEATEQLKLSFYLAGNAYLQAGEYLKAINWFKRFEKEYEGVDFRKDTAYKLFLAYYLEGNLSEAKRQFDRIREVGGTETESDRYAARAYAKGYPSKEIMMIRMATDGGFYERAEEISDELSIEQFKKKEDRVEFIYRKARLYHFTNRPVKAIEAYLETISRQGDERWYYAPNSCLQLGYLYLEKDRQRAKKYFERIFDYTGYEYKKGIERKAQSALLTYF